MNIGKSNSWKLLKKDKNINLKKSSKKVLIKVFKRVKVEAVSVSSELFQENRNEKLKKFQDKIEKSRAIHTCKI